ncbi:Protein sidekick [Hypsibius exemplaris]|uniref:Protein sidekick n=1 Tax=Hypsibius exemplaris TaxID=2072580 RepID=A0A9X6RJN6_HYPEX|nr:Protein sidekick [Hypsibius exemplaris]
MAWVIWLLGIALLISVASGTSATTATDAEAPRIILQPQLTDATNWTSSVVIVPGSSRTLHCVATGNPRPKYRWLKDNQPLNELLLDTSDWTLNPVSQQHAGVYRCLAENSCGSLLSDAIELKVAHITQFEPFTEPLRRIKAGEALLLRLPNLNSIPAAVFSWLVDDAPISLRDHRKYVLTLDNALVVLDAGQEDSARFRVDAYNEQLVERRSSGSVSVIVQDANLVPDHFPPQLVVPPVNLTVKHGAAHAVFECIINARPLPELRTSWRRQGRDGKLLALADGGGNYLLSRNGHRLTILQPDQEDEGFYECLGELPQVGTISHRAYLTVGTVPVIVQRPDVDIQADPSQTVIIPCIAEGNPTPSTAWYRNSQILSPAGTDKLTIAANGSLIVSQINDQHAGVYQCFRQNAFGEESVSTWLRMKRDKKPDAARTARVSEDPFTVTVLENQPARLPCSGSTSLPSDTAWFFNDTPISTTNSNYQTDLSGDLLISFATRALAGNYACVTRNAAGSSKQLVALTVSDRTRISSPPKDTRLVIGSKVTFGCGVTKGAGVNADIQWYQDGKLLDAATRTARRQVRPDGSLEIISARNSDIGTYTCRVFSANGNDSQSAKLDVIELPYAPHIRSELLNGTKTVNVSWLPDFDGNAPITGFVLQYKQVSDSAGPDPTASLLDIGWQTLLSNFSATDRFYIVKDLRPSASYQFRVSAVNNVGEGSPSAASNPILLPQTPPTSAPKFAASSRNSTAIMVQWQPPAESDWNGILRGFMIRYKLAGYNDGTWTEVPVPHEARRNYILEDLIAWKLYEIQMAAFNDKGTGVWSDSARVKTQEGVPEAAPTDVEITSPTSTSLLVSWRPPDPQLINGINQGYRVELWNSTSVKPLESVEVPPSPYDLQERQTHTFSGLLKFAPYNVTVLCFTGAGNGPRSHPVTVTTLEDKPGPVQSLHIFNIRDRTLELSWLDPEQPNGLITGFTVQCSEVDGDSNRTTTSGRTFPLRAELHGFTVDGLQPQTNYLVKVFASTKMGDGDARVARIQSSVPPTLPCPPTDLEITNIEARKVVVTFNPVCDGNTSILQITLDTQTRDMRADEWRRFSVEKINVSGNKLDVLGLAPFAEYRVRLTMENVVGPSLPSQPSDWFQTLPASPSNPPGNFTLRAINATAIRARWTPLVTSQWNGKPGNYWISFRSLNSSVAAARRLAVNDSTSGSVVLGGLDEFTTYEARIGAANLIGSSDASSVAVTESTRESVPSFPPESVVAHGIGSTVIIVQWTNITAAHENGIILGWKIFYTPGGGAAVQVLDVPDAGTHSATLANLEKYREYNIQVAGYTRIGVGAMSVPVMERTLEDVPGRPYNVFFPEVSLNQVRITWEPPLRPNGVILGYRISYKEDGTVDDLGSVFLPANARSFLAAGVFAERSRYYFTLSANTSVGWGGSLEMPVKVVGNRERPERPTKPSVSISMVQPRSLYVNWQPGRRDENAPVRYFQIQYAELGDGAWKSVAERVDGRTSSHIVRGLTPNTAYQFRVQSLNDVGPSEWSDDSDVAQTAEDVPEAIPLDFNAVPYTTTSLTLSWRSPSLSTLNGRLAGYSIQFHRLLPGIPPASIPYSELVTAANSSDYNLTDLARDATYELRIAAFTAVGAGPFSSPLTVYVGEAVPLSRPTDIAIESTSTTSATVTWTPAAPPMDGSGILTGYKMFYFNTETGDEGVDFVEPSVSRHTIRSLRPFTPYVLSLVSFNAAGDGPRAAAVNFTTLEGLPQPPEDLVFERIQTSSLTVRWKAPRRSNGRIRGYEIAYHLWLSANATGKTNGRKLTGPNDTFVTLTGLDEVAAYSVSVRAETAKGFGNATLGNVTTGPQPGSPAQPTRLSVDLTEAAVHLRWINGAPGNTALSGYLIQGKRDETSTWETIEILQNGKTEQHELSYLTLAPSTRYSFRVVAENSHGVSQPSEPSLQIQTPNWNSVVGLAPKKPFYLEVWFLILVAAGGSVLIILLVACLCIKSKAAKYRQEVEKVISTADILQFPDDDEFAAPTAFELRQSMRRSTRKPHSIKNNIYCSSAAAASMRRNHALANAARAPPFTITQAPDGVVPSIAFSDIGDVSDIYPPHVNRGFVHTEDERRNGGPSSTATTSRASSSLTEKPSEMHNESSTDEVDDDGSGKSVPEEEEPDDQASSFVNHYANINNTLRRPWAETAAGTSDSRRSRLPQAPPPPRPAYRKSTATSISGSIADSDVTSLSLNGPLVYDNKAGCRLPLPGFSSFV